MLKWQHKVRKQPRAKPQRVTPLVPIVPASNHEGMSLARSNVGAHARLSATLSDLVLDEEARKGNCLEFNWRSEERIREPESRDGANFAATARNWAEAKHPRGRGLPDVGQRSASSRASPISARTSPPLLVSNLLPKIASDAHASVPAPVVSARHPRAAGGGATLPKPDRTYSEGFGLTGKHPISKQSHEVIHNLNPHEKESLEAMSSWSPANTQALKEAMSERKLDEEWEKYEAFVSSSELHSPKWKSKESKEICELPKLLQDKTKLDRQDLERGRLKQLLRDGRVDTIRRELTDRVNRSTQLAKKHAADKAGKEQRRRSQQVATERHRDSIKDVFDTVAGRKKTVTIKDDRLKEAISDLEKGKNKFLKKASSKHLDLETSSGSINAQRTRKSLSDVRKSMEMCVLTAIEQEREDMLNSLQNGSNPDNQGLERRASTFSRRHSTKSGSRKDSKRSSVSGQSDLHLSIDPEDTAYILMRISSDLNLPLEDIRKAKDFFDKFDTSQDGVLSKSEFNELLKEVMEVDDLDEVPSEMRDVMWKEADRDGNGNISFEEFAKWYSAHGFLEDLLLTPAQKAVREMARTYELSLIEVENIKAKFDAFDEDKSGVIEIEEFSKLIYVLLKIPKHLMLPPSRVRQFWSEIDFDCSGAVEFEEFLIWYMKYFRNTDDDTSPIEDFYRSQRRLPGAI